MKGIIFDIRSFSVHDGPGIRTSFFLKGCPLRCSWCHNPESHLLKPEIHAKKDRMGDAVFTHDVWIGHEISVGEVMERAIADKPFFDASGGITLTGGEPLMQADFVLGILEAAEKEQIHTALDTSGFAVPAVFQKTVEKADLVMFDLKIIDREAHQQHTGVSNELILQNFNWLLTRQKEIIVRVPLIQNITDTPENLESIRQLIENTRVKRLDLLPFHHYARSKYNNLGLNFEHKDLGVYPAGKLQHITQFFSNTTLTVSVGG